MSKYRPERLWPRLVPTNSVMVSVFAGEAQAYGLIANISEAGSCVVSGVHFEPGTPVLLRIGFEFPDNPFTTEAKIIWSRDETEPGQKATFVHGVKFFLIAEQRMQLRAILNRPGFKAPVIPGEDPSGTGKFHAMMVDLNEDLDQLATKVQRKTETS